MLENAMNMKAESCAHQSQGNFWRKEPHRKSVWFSEHEGSYYDHLRAKVQSRSTRPSVIRSGRLTISRLSIPAALSDLRNTIEESRAILTLKDDWDEEGSPRYSESTWNRAQSFLMKNALQLWRRRKMCFDAPKIQPGPSGSIDLHWRTPNRELLINIPANPEEAISYYGDNKDDETENAVRGKNLDSSSDTEWIFLWLMK